MTVKCARGKSRIRIKGVWVVELNKSFHKERSMRI